jgi:hypothetical protein
LLKVFANARRIIEGTRGFFVIQITIVWMAKTIDEPSKFKLSGL